MSEQIPILDRMVRAVEKVRERLLRSTSALGDAGIPYAVVGGNAVAAWVAKVDEAAVRNTADVDLLLNRIDLDRARSALAGVGFHYVQTLNVDTFLDGADANPRSALHVLFAGEKVKDHDLLPSPTLDESEPGEKFRLIGLTALVRMKLVSYRFKDRTHLLDLIGLGLVDASWTNRLPIDNPES
ncbi:MAG: hypothetical protein JNM18_00690 [Planctomycetaceae bacterium]|nr:hypothetical protein [Planctomycetaceae bacterium]